MPTTQQFTETPRDQNGTPMDTAGLPAAVWASSNPAVASVNSSGLATRGASSGTTNITVTRGSVVSNAGVITVPASGGTITTLADLIAALGGNSRWPACYDVGVNTEQTTDLGGGVYECGKWDDFRGASGFGPSWLQATNINRPRYTPASKILVFDGVNDKMDTAVSSIFDISGAMSVVLIGSAAVGTGGPPSYAWAIKGTNADATAKYIALSLNATGFNTESDKGGAAVAQSDALGGSVIRALIVSKNASNGIALDAPNKARVTAATGGAEEAGSNSASLGGLWTGNNCMGMTLKTLMFCSQQVVPSDITAIKNWAVAQRGATLF